MVDVRALATDGVVMMDGQVVLLERDHPPYEGAWVLPGGLVEPDETARAACRREVREEIGLRVDIEGFVGLYDDPDRDERGNVSAAFRCRPQGDRTPTARDEARTVSLFDPATLPAMGFDHRQIVRDTVGME